MKLQKKTSKRLVCTAFCALLFFLALRFYNQRDFYYDAVGYWRLGNSFWQGDGFSLLNYPDNVNGVLNIRGYLFPLILGFFQFTGHPYFLFAMFSGGMTALLICVLIPNLLCAEDEFYSKPRYMIGCFVVSLVTLYFWKDLLRFPLSDLPALFFYAGSVCLSFRILHENSLFKTAIWSFLWGLTLYASYNIRTVYLIPAIILILFVIGCFLLCKKHQAALVVAGGCMIGIMLLSIPQIIINQNCFGISSPMLQTTVLQTTVSGKSSLFVAQLEWGIKWPRYETYIGDNAFYPDARVFYISRPGCAALNGGAISSIGEFIAWGFQHILLAMGLYWEHFISAITMFYTEVYLTDIRINVAAFLLNCGIWMFAFIGLMAKAMSFKIRKTNEVTPPPPCLFLLIPVVLALPAAGESRFYFAAYLLIYGFLVMKMDLKEAWKFFRSHPVIICSLLFVIMLTWCMVANNLLSSIEFGELTLTGQYIPGG